MKIARRIILSTALLLCLGAGAEEQVLWWRVADENNPRTFTIGSLVYQELLAESIRLRMVGNGRDVYLPLVDPDHDLGEQTTGDLPGNFYADVSDYSNAAYSFAVELGNETDGKWTIMASTGYYTYAALNELHYIGDWTDISTNIVRPWLPSFTVPEPCSGLLLLLGGGLLALRRRRRA